STQYLVYVDDLMNIFTIDAIRYFVLHEIPYLSDGCLTYDLIDGHCSYTGSRPGYGESSQRASGRED
ncbi:MAG: hypothetical protein Q8830_03290, partial [Candidatus Phytoplasma australasiaticum]|nr:hypothetical protein [Candidatus Phytoplasma australasiaticum]